MADKVRSLYDFEAQPNSGELSLAENDILTVTNKNVGDGWWEGTNERGETGFFPETYVTPYEEEEDSGPPPMAPPPLPADYDVNGGSSVGQMGWSSAVTNQATSTAQGSSQAAAPAKAWDDNWGFPEPPTLAELNQQPTQQNDWGYDGDDWDSDEDFDTRPNSGGTSTLGNTLVPPKTGHSGGSADNVSLGRDSSKRSVTAGGRTNFYRFSPFVKSGGENYLLGKSNGNIQESDIIQVVDNGDETFSWLHTKPAYSCRISSHKKDSKFGGLKSYTAYQLTPSFNNLQVSRRYKHFDWLHERLVEKFTVIPIPPLPDKQIQGRYEEEFIEHRMNQLQSFVDRVTSHPILSQSEVLNHFLTCTDDRRWKDGKRKAEKDPLVGGSFFMTIKVPEKPIREEFLDRQLEIFNKFCNKYDVAVNNMLKVSQGQTGKCQTTMKREFQGIGRAFLQLGEAMQHDGSNENTALSNAVNCTGEAYEEIAKIVDAQPKHDWEPYGDVMHDYRGLLAAWPGIMGIHQGAASKRKEFEKLGQEGKIPKSELTDIGNRSDVISYGVLAEINTFHQIRVRDMKKAHQNFLREQISFYQKVTEKLQEALREYDNC